MRFDEYNSYGASARLFLLLLTMVSITALGQVAGGNVTGTMTDFSRSPIPNAQVVVKNRATDVTRTVTANGDGFYSAPNLQPGDYEVTASPAAFGPKAVNVTLTVGEDLVLSLTLRVGGVAHL
jgi:hypothetical protein